MCTQQAQKLRKSAKNCREKMLFLLIFAKIWKNKNYVITIKKIPKNLCKNVRILKKMIDHDCMTWGTYYFFRSNWKETDYLSYKIDVIYFPCIIFPIMIFWVLKCINNYELTSKKEIFIISLHIKQNLNNLSKFKLSDFFYTYVVVTMYMMQPQRWSCVFQIVVKI